MILVHPTNLTYGPTSCTGGSSEATYGRNKSMKVESQDRVVTGPRGSPDRIMRGDPCNPIPHYMREELPRETDLWRIKDSANDSNADSDYEYEVFDTLGVLFARAKSPSKVSLRLLNPGDADFCRLMNYRYYLIPDSVSYHEVWHKAHLTKKIQTIQTHLNWYQLNRTALKICLPFWTVTTWPVTERVLVRQRTFL